MKRKIDFEPILYVTKTWKENQASRDENYSINFMSYTEKNFPSMSEKIRKYKISGAQRQFFYEV